MLISISVKYGQNLEYLIIDTSLERGTITKPLTELKNLKCFKLIGGTFETSDLMAILAKIESVENRLRSKSIRLKFLSKLSIRSKSTILRSRLWSN